MQFDVMAFTRCRHKTALLAEVKGYNSQDTMEKMNFFFNVNSWSHEKRDNALEI